MQVQVQTGVWHRRLEMAQILRAVGIAVAWGLSASVGSAATDCTDPQDQTTMNVCAGEAYAAADAELNTAYKQIVARLAGDPDGLAALRAAERAWVAFRDAECAFQSSGVEGGSIYPMVQAGCLEGLTRDRLEALNGYLACEEGDLSCPAPPAD